jgi:predicted anti-sigma-YlaC factor YlaD
MDGNLFVGGLWCNDVLAGLSEYLDGELSPEMIVKVERHLQGCENCQRFGADMAALLASVATFHKDLPPDVRVRLRQTISTLKSS